MNRYIQSILKPAMAYLRIASPEPSELDKLQSQRRQIREKLVLTDRDRMLIERLDSEINNLEQTTRLWNTGK
jgi:hypothetical protein